MRRLGRRTVYTPPAALPPPPPRRRAGSARPTRSRYDNAPAGVLGCAAKGPRGCRTSAFGRSPAPSRGLPAEPTGGVLRGRRRHPPALRATSLEGGACGGLRSRAPKRRLRRAESELAPAPSARGLPLAAGGVHRAPQRLGVRLRAKPGPLEGAVGGADWGVFCGGGGDTHRRFAPPPSEGGACGGLRPRVPKGAVAMASELAPAPFEGAVGGADWGCFAGAAKVRRGRSGEGNRLHRYKVCASA